MDGKPAQSRNQQGSSDPVDESTYAKASYKLENHIVDDINDKRTDPFIIDIRRQVNPQQKGCTAACAAYITSAVDLFKE